MATVSTALWPLAAYFAAVLLLVGAMLGLSYLLGERHQDRSTGDPYESGIVATGSARVRLSVKYYLMAILFVIFDLEAAFIFAWAVAFPQLDWLAYGEIVIFVGVLLAGLAYLWRVGALDWGTTHRERPRPRQLSIVAQPLEGVNDELADE